MFKKILLCGMALFSGLVAGAQSPSGSLLWKVTGNGLQQPSYLYGTIHLICKNDLHFSPAALQALKQSGELYLEIKMDEPDFAAKSMPLMMMSGDYSLRSLFSAEDYTFLSAYVKDSLGADLAMLDKVKPLVVVSLLSQMSVSCKDRTATETALIALAKEQQKPVKGLETVADQIAVFDSIPDKEEARMIMQMVREIDKSKAQFEQLSVAYQQQNIRQLYDIIASSPDIAPFKNVLLDKRNIAWIPTITAQMKAKTTFFACGAGHLEGEKGVIALLRKEGYKVEAVK